MFKFIKTMNRKVLVSIIFALVIFLSGFGYIVINNMVTAFKPVSMNLSAEQRATVSGNGGNAVIVGDYVYFIGNYVERTSIEYKQNEYNKVKYGAIYRVKLDSDTSAPVYEDADRLSDPRYIDYVPHLVDDMKLIVPKVAGFEESALYVFDKYLIYTSPNNNKDKYGNLQINKIDFYRVDLDGRNHRHVYTTSSMEVTKDDFTVACYGTKKDIYLLIKDGEKLNRVNVTGNIGKVDTISKNATSFVLPVVSAYTGLEGKSLSVSYGGVMNFVYYTEALSEEDIEEGLQGNVLKQYWVSKGTSKELAKLNHVEFGLLGLGNGRLLYTVKEGIDIAAVSMLYMTKDNTDADSSVPFVAATRGNYLVYKIDTSEEKFYLPTEYNADPDSIFVSTSAANSSMYLYRKLAGANANENAVWKKVNDVESIIAITGSTVYYKSTNGDIMHISLQGNLEAVNTGWRAASLTRLTFFSQNNLDRIFYIKTFADVEGEESTTVAMMGEIRETVKEFVLGRVDDKYLPENLKEIK